MRLVSGPTIVTRNSVAGEGGSLSIFETPPNMNNVIRFTGNPRAMATRECASSCRSTEKKNSKEANIAAPQVTKGLQSGWRGPNNAVDRVHVTNRKIKNQLQSIYILIPKILMSLKPLPTIGPLPYLLL